MQSCALLPLAFYRHSDNQLMNSARHLPTHGMLGRRLSFRYSQAVHMALFRDDTQPHGNARILGVKHRCTLHMRLALSRVQAASEVEPWVVEALHALQR